MEAMQSRISETDLWLHWTTRLRGRGKVRFPDLTARGVYRISPAPQSEEKAGMAGAYRERQGLVEAVAFCTREAAEASRLRASETLSCWPFLQRVHVASEASWQDQFVTFTLPLRLTGERDFQHGNAAADEPFQAGESAPGTVNTCTIVVAIFAITPYNSSSPKAALGLPNALFFPPEQPHSMLCSKILPPLINSLTSVSALAQLSCVVAVLCAGPISAGDMPPISTPTMEPVADRFQEEIRPFLVTYCYDCHGYGGNEGGRAFDTLEQEGKLLRDRELWWAVLRNVRAGVMPPQGMDRPGKDEVANLTDWVYRQVFDIDPADPSPGAVTVRRLNRVEYRNTIRDLLGVDYDTELLFPPDDSGYGFDNNGDVLSLSPLLMEKYLTASDTIIREAVPRVNRVVARREIEGWEFRTEDGKKHGLQLNCEEADRVSHTHTIKSPGKYTLEVNVRVRGSFNFDPGRCKVAFTVNGEKYFEDEYQWENHRLFTRTYELDLEPGEYEYAFDVTPLPPKEGVERDGDTSVRISVESVNVIGPQAPEHWVAPQRYDWFFTRDCPPEDTQERRAYRAELLGRFARRAYRRPVDAETLNRLVDAAEFMSNQPDGTFESGVADAMAMTLASPRFLFRIEETIPDHHSRYPLIDEFSLASRLSYFLWSTMPDQQLLDLAEAGQLRANLNAQIDRMLADPRASQLTTNFVGQWLRTRDVMSVFIDPELVLAGDEGETVERETPRGKRGRRRRSRTRFDQELREAMRQETEMLFEYLVAEDRDLLELVDNNYTFLNERLAEHYGIDGVEGEEMRRVELPADAGRGGVLTHGSFLTVTSNPTRTSPVKRGVFILENILGTPPPPPPPDIPQLEETAEKLGAKPTVKEVLAAHRDHALCASCHARFDPMGLALENFNALGMLRDSDQGQPIEVEGELITGERFEDFAELRSILVNNQRESIYRCIAEKLLTYAIGRGMEYHDEPVLDEIVCQMVENEGRFSTLVRAVILSAPFQRTQPPPDDIIAQGGQIP